MSVGGDTYISNMMQIAGFENVCRDRQRYPELSDAEIIQSLAPEVILLSSEPYPFTEKHISAGYKNCLPEAVILLADGELFSWYGSRLLQAFDYFGDFAQVAEFDMFISGKTSKSVVNLLSLRPQLTRQQWLRTM
jgi:ABC-type Fe3+-hydroxamate transport system substrate-binding protein